MGQVQYKNQLICERDGVLRLVRNISAQAKFDEHLGPFRKNGDMIQALIQRVQNFADALFAGFSKTAQDGRKVLYPWGIFGRGYVIASEEDEKRLKQIYAVFLVVVFVFVPILMEAGHALLGYPGSLGVVALTLVCYAIYVTRLTANMEPSGEGQSLTGSYRAMARKLSPRQLWTWTITGIFLVYIGIVSIVLDPENRTSLTFFVIGIGGFIAAFGGWMLALRRGATPAEGPPPVGESVVAEEAAFYITGVIGPVRAWLITIFGLVLTGLGIFLFVVDPGERSNGAGIIAICGPIAAFGIAMLVLRYRHRHS